MSRTSLVLRQPPGLGTNAARKGDLARRAVLRAAACLLLVHPAFAAELEAASKPREFIDNLGGEVITILRAGVPQAEREQRFRDLFARAFDVPTIGRFVIGRYWTRISPEERSRYLDVFRRYVAAIYALQFSHYAGETFRTTSERSLGEGEGIVQSLIERPPKAPLAVAFRVKGEPGSFKIVDVVVENVSLIITKRDEFASVLNQEGLDGVMKRMQAALDQPQGG